MEECKMHRMHRRILAVAAALAAAGLAGHANTAQAATITVTNCSNGGAGSLRNAVAIAASGDTIDLQPLGCTRIDLTSGAIAIAQNNLEIVGPGPGSLLIDAGHLSSVFRHSGTGTLAIRGMTIARGFYASSAQAFGGCIYSAGSVALGKARVHWCVVKATGLARAFGAGIYAAGSVTLVRSQVTGNTGVDEGAFMQPEGAGVYTLGRLTAVRSRICGNHARRAGGAWVGNGLFVNYTTISHNDGGALEAKGEALIFNSTISNNKAAWWTVTLDGVFDNVVVAIVNSTISGNRATYNTVNMTRGTRSIFNSTIAYNYHAGGCLNAAVFTSSGATHVESTIAAKNFCGGSPYYDLGGFAGDSLIGANNLIMSSTLPTPADTITVDPRLAPLANNGGPTLTHALLSGSPAIDTGNNAAGLTYDQRGPGHPRVNGKPDIGAFER
jgi:hypothetical protein